MPQNMKEAALEYADRGWPIFPCRTDKTPHTMHGVLDATTDKRQIEEWWDRWPGANIGLDVGGAGMMVLDLDPGHDLEELERNTNGLPDTQLIASTPRGGKHLYFALDEKEIVSPSTSKMANHVDVRSFNSYVLLAPSVTKDGTYTWEGEGKPAFRTDEMVRLANTYREKHDDRDTWLIEPDMPENIEAAIRWLRNDARIAIEGLGGDHTAYATAAHMKSFGISEATALELIWEHWNPRCLPPWSADEFDHMERKVRNAYSYNTSPPGNITEAYRVAARASLFKPVVSAVRGEGIQASAGRFKFYDREALASIKPPEWLLPGVLPEASYAILFGSPGTFKTFIALDIALSLATGFPLAPVWGVDAGKAGPILFAAGEGNAGMERRVRAWERVHYDDCRVGRDFYLGAPVPRINDTEIDQFIDGALSISPAGYKLVVIDTIGRAMQGANENSQEYASMFTHMVEVIQAELGCTVLALHHTGHGDGSRERGSTVFGADADTRLKLDRKDKDYMVTLEVVKQKDAAEGDPVSIGLREIDLGDGVKSLCAVKPDLSQVVSRDTKSGSEEALDQSFMQVLDKAVEDTLSRAGRTTDFSTKDLAEILAAEHEAIEVSSKTLQNKWLVALREDHKSICFDRKFYNARKKRWQFRT